MGAARSRVFSVGFRPGRLLCWGPMRNESVTGERAKNFPAALSPLIPLLLFLLLAAGGGMALQAAGRPNLVFLMADDHRAFALGSRGDPVIHTPRLDQLARRGLSFTRCYATSPICMASRASVMTGLYEYRTGCNFGTGRLSAANWNRGYPLRLKRAGYRIAFAGKWGFPLEVPGYEKQFDRWGGFEGAGQGFYETAKNPSLRAYAKKYPHVTLALGAFGRDFIAESVRQGRPFCLSLSFKAPHKPHRYVVPRTATLYQHARFTPMPNYGVAGLKRLPLQPKLGRQYAQRKEWLPEEQFQEHLRIYYRLISGIDLAVGMVLDALRDNGVAGDTVVIYTSDNGYFCGAHGLQGKVLPYDDSARIPLIVYDPRRPENAGRVSSALVGNIDFAPTLLDLAGVPIPEGLDGRSLRPIIEGRQTKGRDSLLLVQNWGWARNDQNRCLAVVTGRYKYIYWCYGDRNLEPVEELFDLRADPWEMNNLAARPEQAAVLRQMRALYDRHHAAWARHCVELPAYREHTRIFDRHIPWRQKRFWTFDPAGTRKPDRALARIYRELVGAEPPPKTK